MVNSTAWQPFPLQRVHTSRPRGTNRIGCESPPATHTTTLVLYYVTLASSSESRILVLYGASAVTSGDLAVDDCWQSSIFLVYLATMAGVGAPPAGGSSEPTYGETVGALRSYLTAPGTMQAASSTVKLTCTHSNLKQRIMELRFDMHESIKSVKDTLYTYNGTSPGMMELRLLRGGTLVRGRGRRCSQHVF